MENKAEYVEAFLEEARPARKFSPLLIQIFAVAGPLVLSISAGMVCGYSAIALPQLQAENSTIPVNVEQGSWIASLVALPMALGCLLSGVLLEKFGRKITLVLTAVPFAFGWILIAASTNVEMLLVGRFVTGLCTGLLGPSFSTYVGEIAEPKYRGIMLALLGVGLAGGIFVAHLLGIFFAWQTVAYISVLLPVVCIVLLLLAPESPTWLFNKARSKKAKETFFWCRGDSAEAVVELNVVIQKQTVATNYQFIWSHCKNPEFWKPLIIINVFFITNQFSGVNAVVFYTISIVQDTVGKGINNYIAMMVIDAIHLVASFMACVLTERYGRRPLTNVSSSGTALSLICLSLFLYCSTLYPFLASVSIIPLVFLISYMVFVSIGLVPLTWTLNGEIFPQYLRGLGSSISACINFIVFFIVVKTTPLMMSCIQPYGTFLAYAGAVALGGIFLYLCLPETKGKTLPQIEEGFNNDHSILNGKQRRSYGLTI